MASKTRHPYDTKIKNLIIKYIVNTQNHSMLVAIVHIKRGLSVSIGFGFIRYMICSKMSPKKMFYFPPSNS